MEIFIFECQAVKIRKELKDSELFKIGWNPTPESEYKHTSSVRELFLSKNKKLLPTVKKVLQSEKNKDLIAETKKSLKKIQQYESMHKSGNKSKIKDLKNLQSLINIEKDKCENGWVFRESRDAAIVPYRLKEVAYKAYREDDPSHLRLVLEYFGHKDLNTLSVQDIAVNIYSDDLEPEMTLQELLDSKNLSFENKDLLTQYEQQMKLMFELHNKIGVQYWGRNKCRTSIHYWYGSSLNGLGDFSLLEAGGIRSKVIIDAEVKSSLTFSTGEGKTKMPTHPYVKCYDITRYRSCVVHVDNLDKYEYDSSIKDKLILPDSHRTLLDILIEQEDDLMEDIVKGKTGGIIVLATGEAGLGKTLTAEVYSEVMGKPLYVVQSSQLGINVQELEKNLDEILQRASRWNAILMIDEADTYIHKRGNDIVQNCIVGVFLRLLEYYKGVLFMTSNRADVVDDAIMSRCTAHIEYKHPEKDNLYSLWEILSKQFGVEMNKGEIKEIIYRYPKMSGRDIKNTIKLMRMVSKKTGKKCDYLMMEKLMPFMNFKVKTNGESGKNN